MSDALATILQALDEEQDSQGKAREKANTIVAAIGTTLTVIITILTSLLDAGLNLPEWTPMLIGALGAVATIFGVSRVRNGVTPSIKENVTARVLDLLDEDNGTPEGQWLREQRDALLHRAEDELGKRGINVDLTPDLPADQAPLTMNEGAPEPKLSSGYVGEHRVGE